MCESEMEKVGNLFMGRSDSENRWIVELMKNMYQKSDKKPLKNKFVIYRHLYRNFSRRNI